ncbi:threonine--tRNA ligase [Candidatus Woesearchaeota archaeon]|nr:threonine--tRNA ligase [Candidatus Woesearchaeota archaeon]|tara:strand:- start:28682 stop:30592 length:1911 start_codon:yes stop_codon:yes gene_type:complete
MAKKTVKVTLPDGSAKQFPSGVTAKKVAESIGKRLAADAVVAEVNGELVDLSAAITKDAEFKVHTFSSDKGKQVFWHSAAHLLAQAVIRLYPKSRLTIGPAIETGFYYDIAHDPFHPSDLTKIEEEMKKIVAANYPVKRMELSIAEAKKKFRDNKYKLEIIKEEAKSKKITAYKQGEFVDLCKGPHAPSTGSIKAFKLTKISSAYWRGDQKNDELQRIYGVSFPDKKELNSYLKNLELAEKNDHRRIGQQLELFMFHDWSPGSPFFLPKGTVIYNVLQEFIRNEYVKRGYTEVITPQLFNKKIWELSGHWEHYKENMFILNVDDTEFSLKPMNCPSHVLIFKSKARSYRELPMKLADFCYLHRNELRGVLSGLTRVRKFSQDDAHIFCTQEQVSDELNKMVDFAMYIYSDVFKLPFSAKFSTRPEKFMGEKKLWDAAEASLENVLKQKKIKYEIDPGEGAFYGPKIDIAVKDALGREHQLVTIQLDFQMPKRMGAEYEGNDGKKHTAVMLHRALIGSFERFMGILIEHYAGKFPIWLNPVQVKILTVADRFNSYAEKVADKYRNSGIRVELDNRAESISYKVREAELAKVNYILVVGEKELKSNTVTARTRDNKILGAIKTDVFLDRLQTEISKKK